MAISTKDESFSKKDRLRELRKFHQSEFDALGVSKAVFLPKMAYQPYGKHERHIAFFESEIKRGEDIYIEFCSKDLLPEDPNRTLYKWRFNSHYQEEYDSTEPHHVTGHVRYLVPVGELMIIKVNDPEETVSEADKESAALNFESLPNPDDGDIPFNQMTLRDYAAIHLKLPVSSRKWLNALIQKAK